MKVAREGCDLGNVCCHVNVKLQWISSKRSQNYLDEILAIEAAFIILLNSSGTGLSLDFETGIALTICES